MFKDSCYLCKSHGTSFLGLIFHGLGAMASSLAPHSTLTFCMVYYPLEPHKPYLCGLVLMPPTDLFPVVCLSFPLAPIVLCTFFYLLPVTKSSTISFAYACSQTSPYIPFDSLHHVILLFHSPRVPSCSYHHHLSWCNAIRVLYQSVT